MVLIATSKKPITKDSLERFGIDKVSAANVGISFATIEFTKKSW
jgi:hypothetical protein